MPSSCGPTLAPLPPSWWQMPQFFSKTFAPRARSWDVDWNPARRLIQQLAQLLIGRRQALEEVGDPVRDVGNTRALQADGDPAILEQPCRGLAGLDGRQ